MALSELTLEYKNSIPTTEMFRSETTKKQHAEEVAIEKISEMILENSRDITVIRLVTMATYSPCEECQAKLKRMFTDWIERLRVDVYYILRVAYLYHSPKHGSGYDSDDKTIEKLKVWKTASMC